MAIIIMTSKDTVHNYECYGIDSVIKYDGISIKDQVLVKFATNRVVAMREANYYDDSDFYATFMTHDGEFKEICYASTRGWTYANGAMIDAPSHMVEAYYVKLRAESEAIRQYRINCILKDCNITQEQYTRLIAVYHGSTWEAVKKLLKTKLRNEFRKKLAAQIREWAEQDNPKYRTPLSAKQLQYI